MWQGKVMAMPAFREGLDIVEEFYGNENKLK
jgi:hypothetical protein